jgi:hypothetical protein
MSTTRATGTGLLAEVVAVSGGLTFALALFSGQGMALVAVGLLLMTTAGASLWLLPANERQGALLAIHKTGDGGSYIAKLVTALSMATLLWLGFVATLSTSPLGVGAAVYPNWGDVKVSLGYVVVVVITCLVVAMLLLMSSTARSKAHHRDRNAIDVGIDIFRERI